MNGPNTKSGERRSLKFLVASLAGGNFAAMGLQMVGGVLVARIVGPATLGIFSGIALVLGYAQALQLGVLNGLNRELPYFVGTGDRQRAGELAAAAQAWVLIMGGIVCAALLGLGCWYLAHDDLWRAVGWLTHAVLVVLLFYTNYLQMTYRTSHDFARLALVGVIQNAAGLALVVSVTVLGFYGLCLRVMGVAAIGALILFWWRPVRVRPRWSPGSLKHLLRIGAPIFIVSQAYALWAVLDRTLVLKIAGTKALGLYSMTVLIGTAIKLLPTAVAQIAYPRMAEHYGRTQSADGIVRIALKPMLYSAAGMVPVVIAGWLLAGPAVRLVMPAYVEAVSAIQWMLPIAVLMCFQPVNSYFNVVRKQKLYLAAILSGIAAYGLALFGLTHDGVYLAAFAQSMLIGQAVFQLVSHAFIYVLERRRKKADALPSEPVD